MMDMNQWKFLSNNNVYLLFSLAFLFHSPVFVSPGNTVPFCCGIPLLHVDDYSILPTQSPIPPLFLIFLPCTLNHLQSLILYAWNSFHSFINSSISISGVSSTLDLNCDSKFVCKSCFHLFLSSFLS